MNIECVRIQKTSVNYVLYGIWDKTSCGHFISLPIHSNLKDRGILKDLDSVPKFPKFRIPFYHPSNRSGFGESVITIRKQNTNLEQNGKRKDIFGNLCIHVGTQNI